MSNKFLSSFCGSCSAALVGADFNKNAAPVEAGVRNEGLTPTGPAYDL